MPDCFLESLFLSTCFVVNSYLNRCRGHRHQILKFTFLLRHHSYPPPPRCSRTKKACSVSSWVGVDQKTLESGLFPHNPPTLPWESLTTAWTSVLPLQQLLDLSGPWPSWSHGNDVKHHHQISRSPKLHGA